jgi:lysophospholipase L1-like esterase
VSLSSLPFAGAETSPAKEIADGVMAIVQRLRTHCPASKVLMLGIFPRGANPSDERRQVCEQATRQFARCADGRHIFFLDIGDAFTQPDGSLSTEIMPDLLHLSVEGYERWARAIEGKLAELMR